jgi:hypothetical protein
MKKYRFLLLLFVLGFIYMGCEENDIDVYDETPRLNLYYGNVAVHFRDSDYVKGNMEKEWSLRVNLQGYHLTEDKNFCMTVRPNDAYSLKANVSFADSYVFPKDSIYRIFTINVSRPENLTTTKAYLADICFDLDNPLHQFDPGREDKEVLPLEVYYVIRRTNWNEWQWGEYSDAKYFFMMDHFKATIDDIPEGDETQKEIYDAYEEYKKNNPPLLDDKGNEIVFKKVE